MIALPLDHVTIRIAARVERPIRLHPHAGTALRGAIGDAMRWHHCVTDLPTCSTCPVFEQCSFGPVWQPRPDASGSPPAPYVISPPAWRPDGRRYRVGDALRFHVVLLGWARTRTGALVDAVRNALAHRIGGGRARLESAWIGSRQISDVDGRLTLGLAGQPLRFEEQGGWREDVRLTFRTPWQSETGDGELAQFEPHRFTEHLLARLARLCERHGTGPFPLDGDELRMQARTARVVTDATMPVAFVRESARQQRRIPMRGRVGVVEVANVTRPVRALWRLAMVTHAGKKAALGFGSVRMEAMG